MRPLTKYDLKILRFINKHPRGISRAALLAKFHCNSKLLDELCDLNYINNNYEFPHDKDGFIVGELPDTALYTISTLGIAEVEAHQWFDLQYVITQILVPIMIALCTYALTCFLGNYF